MKLSDSWMSGWKNFKKKLVRLMRFKLFGKLRGKSKPAVPDVENDRPFPSPLQNRAPLMPDPEETNMEAGEQRGGPLGVLKSMASRGANHNQINSEMQESGFPQRDIKRAEHAAIKEVVKRP